MLREEFAGASKASVSFLSPLEKRMARRVLPKIPSWLETYHLTLLTILWSGLIILFGYFASTDIRWLWAVSLVIVLQYVTDFFDGKIGKYRDTGLVRWGFYMDHLLDYFFLCGELLVYAFLLPEGSRFQIFYVFAVFCGYMMSSFLAITATGSFRITHMKFGPTEFRIALIIINTLFIFFGTRYLAKGLRYVAIGGIIMLAVVIYRTQKEIWRLDMEVKR